MRIFTYPIIGAGAGFILALLNAGALFDLHPALAVFVLPGIGLVCGFVVAAIRGLGK